MKGLLFDLDGTLVDTIGDIRAALNHTLGLCYCRPISLEECRTVVGRGLRRALVDSLWFSRSAFPEDELDILYGELVSYYSSHVCVSSRVYDGVVPFLEKARGRGLVLGVLSNKADSLVQELVGRLFRPGQFDFVRGLRDADRPKPDNDSVFDFIKLCNGGAGDVTIIGDSEVDWQTAVNAGCRPMILSTGYRTRQELSGKGVNPIADSLEEVEKNLWN